MCGRRGSAGAGQSRPRARACRNRLVFCSARDSAFAPGPAAKRSLQERTRAVKVFLPWTRKHPRFRHAISASGRLVYRRVAPATSGLSHFDRDGYLSLVREVKKKRDSSPPPGWRALAFFHRARVIYAATHDDRGEPVFFTVQLWRYCVLPPGVSGSPWLADCAEEVEQVTAE